ASDGTPSSSEYDIHEGERLRRYRIRYRPGGFDYVYERDGAVGHGSDRVPDGAHAHDLQSTLGALRAWRPRLGESANFFVVLGRRLWRAEVQSRGPEVIKV